MTTVDKSGQIRLTDNEFLNAVAEVVMARFEHVRLSLRYGAAQTALDTVKADLAANNAAPAECFCCTCTPTWDHACRNHGAHGVRACATHRLPGEACDCCEIDPATEETS